MESDIVEFFKNKDVFLTGGTGFVGKVFLEKILRVTEVGHVYVLVRAKADKTVKQRIEDIFKDPLYEKLLSIREDPLKRVIPVSGDCTLPQLGLSPEDRLRLVENVDVVVHGAATVRFNEPLSSAIAINTRATLDLLDLAKQMKKLKSFVHISSAFANCLDFHIEESFYTERLNVTADKICQIQERLGDEEINRISSKLLAGFPNTYCYTKALAEEAVLRHSGSLPICIFRPGIVLPTCEEPISGWVDNLYGPTSILYGVAFGVLRVMFGHADSKASLVPVDYCANLVLACAWRTAISHKQAANRRPVIYNLVPEEGNILKWSEYKICLEKHGAKMPLSTMMWFPFLIFTSSFWWYKVLCFLYHTIPGYILDFFLMAMGKQPRLVKTYRKIHKQNAFLRYFVAHNWTFSMRNTKELWHSMSATDRKLFNFDMLSLNWSHYFYYSLSGMRRYLAKEEPDTIPKGLTLLRRFMILHRTVQVLLCGAGIWLLWNVLSILRCT